MEKFNFFFFQQFLNLQISISKLYSNLVRSKFQTIKIISRIHYTTPMSWSQPTNLAFPQRCETIELFTGSGWSAAKLKISIAFFPTHSPVLWIRSFWTRVTRIHIRKIRLTSCNQRPGICLSYRDNKQTRARFIERGWSWRKGSPFIPQWSVSHKHISISPNVVYKMVSVTGASCNFVPTEVEEKKAAKEKML